jgi:hypothetical protein
MRRTSFSIVEFGDDFSWSPYFPGYLSRDNLISVEKK